MSLLFQVARSTTIVFVVIFSAILLHKYQSRNIIFCCLLVAGGFILGVDQEKVVGSLSVKGVVFGVLSSIFIALTAIYTKKALEVVDKNEVSRSTVHRLILGRLSWTIAGTTNCNTVQFNGP